MLRTISAVVAVVVFSLGFTRTVTAQTRLDPATLIAAQTKAMTALSAMDGVWRGPAWTILPSGEKHHVMQTERIGPFLGGSVKFIEGRGYDTSSGQVVFDAFGIVSFEPRPADLQYRATGVTTNSPLRPTVLRGRFPRGLQQSATLRSSRMERGAKPAIASPRTVNR